MLVRGFYYDGWHPSDKPRKERKREEFLAHMAQAFDCNSDANPETITRAVLQVVSRHVSAGEIQGVKSSLPEAIRLLWTEA